MFALDTSQSRTSANYNTTIRLLMQIVDAFKTDCVNGLVDCMRVGMGIWSSEAYLIFDQTVSCILCFMPLDWDMYFEFHGWIGRPKSDSYVSQKHFLFIFANRIFVNQNICQRNE